MRFAKDLLSYPITSYATPSAQFDECYSEVLVNPPGTPVIVVEFTRVRTWWLGWLCELWRRLTSRDRDGRHWRAGGQGRLVVRFRLRTWYGRLAYCLRNW